jgi:hypothetical protein
MYVILETFIERRNEYSTYVAQPVAIASILNAHSPVECTRKY